MKELTAAHVSFIYEPGVIPYVEPAQNRKYTPDILIVTNGILIESKGYFITKDRKKHLYVKAQYPDLDLRFVFSNPHQKIGKTSKTTYAMWAEKNGFKWAGKSIPQAWYNEPPNLASMSVLRELKLLT